jgi:Domain of unknown function (DUF1737)
MPVLRFLVPCRAVPFRSMMATPKTGGIMAAAINEYTVVSGKSDVELIGAVTKLLKQGWRPIGGVAIAPTNPATFLQALVR